MSDGARDETIPVDILTGFLGAGKTTLIRRLVESGRLKDTAILVNEFASLPLDQRLIALSGGDAAVIGDGCVCCVVDGNIRAALLGLIEQRASGAVPAFSRVLIETSGIADPVVLLATLATDRMLKPRFSLGRVVTLVDLSQDPATLAEDAETVAQLLCADLFFLTKSEMAEVGGLEASTRQIAAFNPIAGILADDGSADPFEAAMPARRPARVFSATPGRGHGTVRAGVLHWPEPVEWTAFATWLSLVVHRHGGNLLRVKGTVSLIGDGRRATVLVQSVRHIIHRPEHLTRFVGPDGIELVVILRDLDPAALQRSLSAFIEAAATGADVPTLSRAG